MNGSDRSKRSYSLLYRIYRRIRYVRYLRRKRKEIVRLKKNQEKDERRLLRENMKAHVAQLKEQERRKTLFERDRARREEDEVRQRIKEQESLTREIIQEEVQQNREQLKKEKAFERRNRRRLLRYSIKHQIRALISTIRDFRFSSIIHAIKSAKANRRLYSRITFNSTVLFLLSYFALYLIGQLATVVAARLFSYPTIIYYWEIYFNISVEDWYHDSVKTIFSSGPILALFTGIILMIVFNTRKELTNVFRLFLLWGFLHGISMFFGAMLVGTLFEHGLGHVISWMYIMDTGKVMYSIVSIFMLVVAGMVSVKPFLLSGNSYFNEMTRQNRRLFIWAQVILPYILGTLALIILRLPRFMFYETFVTMTLFVSLIPVISGYSSYNELFFDEEKKSAYLEWKYFFILAAILIFYRGILNFGIPVAA